MFSEVAGRPNQELQKPGCAELHIAVGGDGRLARERTLLALGSSADDPCCQVL